MKVEVGNQVFSVELVDTCSESLRNVIVRHVLPNNGSILCFYKSVVIGVIWSTLCLLRFPPFEELVNDIVDVLTSVITVEVLDDEWKKWKRFVESRFYADFL